MRANLPEPAVRTGGPPSRGVLVTMAAIPWVTVEKAVNGRTSLVNSQFARSDSRCARAPRPVIRRGDRVRAQARPKPGRRDLQLAQFFGGRFRYVKLRVSIRTGAMRGTTDLRPALRLVQPAVAEPVEFSWFCGHCAAPSHGEQPPAPMARVCRSCGLGVMLETRADIAPSHRDAFLVIDSSLLVQAMSWRAETLLGVTEDSAVNRPVVQLLIPADAEAGRPARFAAALAEAAAGADEPVERVRAALEHVRRAAPGAGRVVRAPAGRAGGPRGPVGARASRRQLAPRHRPRRRPTDPGQARPHAAGGSTSGAP